MEYLLFPYREEEESLHCIGEFSFINNRPFCSFVIGGANCRLLDCRVFLGSCDDFIIPQRGINP